MGICDDGKSCISETSEKILTLIAYSRDCENYTKKVSLYKYLAKQYMAIIANPGRDSHSYQLVRLVVSSRLAICLKTLSGPNSKSQYTVWDSGLSQIIIIVNNQH